MGLNVGELIATLKLDTKQFTTNIRQAQQQTRNLGTTVSKDLTSSEKQADQATKDLTEEIKTNIDAQQDLADAVVDAADKLKDEGDAAEETAKDMKEAESGSGRLSGALDAVKGGLAAIGVTVGMQQVLQWFTDSFNRASEAQKRIDDMVGSLNAATGASGEVLQQYETSAKQIAADLGDSYAVVGALMGKISTLYDIDGAQLTEFTKEYQSFFDQLAKAGDSFSDFDAINTVMKKWNISLDDNLDYLGMWYEISQKTAVPMSTMMGLLDQGDRAFQLLGMSAEEASNLIGQAYKSGEIADIKDLISSVEMLAAAKADELGSETAASTYMQRLIKETKAVGNEQGMIHMLTSELEINGRVASRLAGFISSTTNATERQTIALDAQRDSLTKLNQEYATWEQRQERAAAQAALQTETIGSRTKDVTVFKESVMPELPAIVANTVLEIEENKEEITRVVTSDEMEQIRQQYNDTTPIGQFNNWLSDVSNSIGEWWDGLWNPGKQETTIVLKDQTRDGIDAAVDARQSAVNSANNPAVR